MAAAQAARGDSAHNRGLDRDHDTRVADHRTARIGPLDRRAVLRRGAAVHLRRRPRVRRMPGLHDGHGGHPRRRAPDHSRGAVDRRGRDAQHRADRVAAAGDRAMADRADRGRRPADRGRGECAAQGGRGAAAVDGVPAVRAVGGSRGHRDHAAVALPACGAGDAAGRRDRPGADRYRRAAGGGRPLGGVGQRRPCRPGAAAGHRRGGAERRQRALGLARDAATPSRAYAAAEELVADGRGGGAWR